VSALPKLKIAVVEDVPAMQMALTAAIGSEEGMEICGQFDALKPALEWLRTQSALDVLLVDLGLPDGSGVELIKSCAALHPQCDILVITMFGDDGNVMASVEAGAKGYILKDSADLNVIRFIHDLRAGGSPMSPLIARKVLNRFRPNGGASTELAQAVRSTAPNLTGKEKEVLDLIARGYTYSEIARLMQVTVNTVRTHVKNVYAKLAVGNRSEAVFEAHKIGLLTLGQGHADFAPDQPI
jgi:DNA-binding NarL/FixJ family response regulator